MFSCKLLTKAVMSTLFEIIVINTVNIVLKQAEGFRLMKFVVIVIDY